MDKEFYIHHNLCYKAPDELYYAASNIHSIIIRYGPICNSALDSMSYFMYGYEKLDVDSVMKLLLDQGAIKKVIINDAVLKKINDMQALL